MKKLIFAVLCCLPLTAFGWSKIGHYTVAEVAQSQLTRRAEKKITKILDNASLAMVSNYADNIKSDKKYNDRYNWHYCNFPADITKAQFDSLAQSNQNGQAFYQIIRITEYLKKNPNDADMLKMLIHLVGDVHQPLHIGHPSDKGGNGVKVKWFRYKTNLHRIWDSNMVESEKMSYTELANKVTSLYPATKQNYSVENLLQWGWETYQITNELYKTSNEVNKTYQYIYKYRNVCDKQLANGGYHLASILNYIYK